MESPFSKDAPSTFGSLGSGCGTRLQEHWLRNVQHGFPWLSHYCSTNIVLNIVVVISWIKSLLSFQNSASYLVAIWDGSNERHDDHVDRQKWIVIPNRMENGTCLKPPTSYVMKPSQTVYIHQPMSNPPLFHLRSPLQRRRSSASTQVVDFGTQRMLGGLVTACPIACAGPVL